MLHRAFQTYGHYKGPLDKVRKGVLISMAGLPLFACCHCFCQEKGCQQPSLSQSTVHSSSHPIPRVNTIHSLIYSYMIQLSVGRPCLHGRGLSATIALCVVRLTGSVQQKNVS